MKRSFLFAFIFTILTFPVLYGQPGLVEKGLNVITTSALKAQLGFLASDWTEGRETGEKGEYLAADYIASMLQLYGLKPGGDYPQARGFTNIQKGNEKTYFQNFVLIKTSPGEEQVFKLRSTNGNGTAISNFTFNLDFTFRLPDSGVELDAPVVFVGYGFKNDKLRYNDYYKIDVKGKFILKLSGSPGFAKALLSPSELSASSVEADNFVKSQGAAGIIEFNSGLSVVGIQPGKDFPDMSPSENNPRSQRPYASYALAGKEHPDNLIRISISSSAANEILKGTGFVTDDYIKKSETKNVNPVPVVKDRSIYFKTTVKSTIVRTRNVIGLIEGTNPDEVIVLGAHYDHLGMSNGYIWNGADDNGSGTVGVMTLAKAFMETGIKPSKTLVFALWSGEEEGLFGSKYYVENPTFPIKNIKLNVNFDMISRYIADDDPRKVIMTYTDSYPAFRTLTETNLNKYLIDLTVEYQPSKDPPGGSDHRSFVAAGVPVMRFKPGHREQYHTPADEVSTLNWDIMEKIIKISFANIWELANNDW